MNPASRARPALFLLLGTLILAALPSLTAPLAGTAGESGADQLAAEYQRTISPLVQSSCVRCHSSKKQEADINLERFTSLAEIRKDYRVWQKVLEMLDSGQMPPKDAKQPSDADKARLRTWVRSYLTFEARSQAGDPGPVVLRRLSNAEYTYTLQDLTGVPLEPARQFPVDGAAGEGFTNAGQALVMSPALLTKYLDAGKEIASHAVLLPDGLRFAPGTTRRDWSDELMSEIRRQYAQHADAEGKLPLAKYLAATIEEREAIEKGIRTLPAVATQRGLNAKYLDSIWKALTSAEPSPVLDPLRVRWRAAKPQDATALAAEFKRWQDALARFQNVGHLKPWIVPVNPQTARQEVRLKLQPPATGNEVVLYLAAGPAGDGNTNDFVVWERPRLVTPGRPDLPLRDVRDFTRALTARRERVFASAAKCLIAAAEASNQRDKADVAELARKHDVETEVLTAWLSYLGIGSSAAIRLDHFTKRIDKAGNYDFVKGWGTSETPLLVANASDQHVRIPGNMKPHGVTVHPSPALSAAVGWRSPITGVVRIEGKVTHAHPECGNGVTWTVEHRRGAIRQRLATGIAQGSKEVTVGPIDSLPVQPGDLVSLLIGPRDGNHACDLTDVEFILKQQGEAGKDWSLTRDVANDIHAGNPHADRHGNGDVWHFYTEPVKGGETGAIIPAGSVLARWVAAPNADEKRKLADEVQKLLISGAPSAKDHPDALLYRQLASLGGPLFAGARPEPTNPAVATNTATSWGLDPTTFGRHPNGSAIEPASLCVQAPALLEIRLPADLVAGSELVTAGFLHEGTGKEGSVQLQAMTSNPGAPTALLPAVPVLTKEGSLTRQRFEASFDEFRQRFPAALCYTKIVPVDEVVTLTLFHREDANLQRLMLDDEQKSKLDRLWNELFFISQHAVAQVHAFNQLMEYATQDSDPRLFEPFRKPIHERAAAFRNQLIDVEPRQLEAVVAIAGRAYRRPLTSDESSQLRGLYQKLREQEVPHDEALRLTLARVFMSPAFLYRIEKAAPGTKPAPVSDWELASRLSYFLSSSLPDAELLASAEQGRLREPEVTVAQTRRMLKDPRVRRLATEFACQWLHIYGFDKLDEKSDRHFPSFKDLRDDMYEESVRFFTDLFQRDGSVLGILDADHIFVNEALAKHYGIPNVTGPEWRRIDGVRKDGRGGILGLSTTLAQQSGASRTSPILRGNWVSEVLLGDKLPRPPKDVPRLPEDEAATEGLTVRQLVEKHSTDERCAVCHSRIDAFGFALEGYDAIGRRRAKDLADRPIDTKSKLKDGAELDGLDGLRKYLLTVKRQAFVRQFNRKLLGYALGRGVQLSDEPLLDEMQQQLEQHDYRFSAAVETIVRSRQFREIRGLETPIDH